MDGWMDGFVIYVPLMVFQSYQDDWWKIMKGCVRQNPVYDWKDFCILESNLGPVHQQSSAKPTELTGLLSHQSIAQSTSRRLVTAKLQNIQSKAVDETDRLTVKTFTRPSATKIVRSLTSRKPLRSVCDQNQLRLVFLFFLHFRSLQRVWRCRQTNLVLDKGGVKISTRNRPLSPWGIISWTELVSLRLVH